MRFRAPPSEKIDFHGLQQNVVCAFARLPLRKSIFAVCSKTWCALSRASLGENRFHLSPLHHLSYLSSIISLFYLLPSCLLSFLLSLINRHMLDVWQSSSANQQATQHTTKRYRIQHPVSRIQNPVSRVQYPDSRIQYPVSNIQYPASSIQYPGSRIQNPVSSIQYPVFSIQYSVLPSCWRSREQFCRPMCNFLGYF